MDDAQDPGECPIHNRVFEVYCTNCHCLICASCLMFEPHKGHQVCKIEEAAKDLRTQMDQAARDGLLKYEISENILLDIRHTKLTCEEKKQKILKEVESTFSTVIKMLKQRKEDVLNEINEHFTGEQESIYQEELSWIQKQEIQQELVNLARGESDLNIINKSHLILTGIEKLREPLKYKKIQLLNTLDSNLYTQKTDSNIKEFLLALEKFVKKGEIINQQYKC